MWLSSKGLQRRRRIKNNQFMCCRTATDPDKQGPKGKMTWQKPDLEITDSKFQGSKDQESTGATGNTIQAQGTEFLENCLFIPPRKTDCKKSTFSTSITRPTDTDFPPKICSKEMKNL